MGPHFRNLGLNEVDGLSSTPADKTREPRTVPPRFVGLPDYFAAALARQPDGVMYAALADAVSMMVANGVLPPGDRLPSLRSVATRLGVSLTTAVRAYRLLIERGVADARAQSGYFVAAPRIVEMNGDERGAEVCSGALKIVATTPNRQQEGDCTIDAPAGDAAYQVGLGRNGEWAWSDARHEIVVEVDAPSTDTAGNSATVVPVAAVFDGWQPGLDSTGRIEADEFVLRWSKWSGAVASKWRLLRDGESVTEECTDVGTVTDGFTTAATPTATWDLWEGGRVVGKAGGQEGACRLSVASAGAGGVGSYEVELCNDGGCSRSAAFEVVAADNDDEPPEGATAGKGAAGAGNDASEPVETSPIDAPPAPSIAWLSAQQAAGVPFDVQWNIWWAKPARAAEQWTLRVDYLADAEGSAEHLGCVDLPVTLDGNRQSAKCPVTLAGEGLYALSVEVCRNGGEACAVSESVTVSTRPIAGRTIGGDIGDETDGGESGGDSGISGPAEAGSGLGGLLAYDDPRTHSACIPASGQAGDYEITSACIASLRADDRFGGACYADGEGDPATDACDNAPAHGRDVIAYAIEWGVYGRDYAMWDLPALRLTHINYSFLRIGREYSGSGGTAKLREHDYDNGVYVADPWASLQNTWSIADNWDLSELDRAGNLHYLRLLKAKFPHLKVLATIGGWTQSSEFYDVANDADARAEFVDSAVAFVKRHGLDGIDIDWEFPGLGVGGDALNKEVGSNNADRDDTRNFTLLMEDLRTGLDGLSSRTGHEYELAAAVSANPKGIARIEYDRLVDVLDAINIMTYDFHGGWDQKTGHQTALYNEADWTDHRFNVASAVAGILAQVDDEQDRARLKGKLNIGVATYGRGMKAAHADIGSAKTGAGGLGSWESGIVDFHDMIPLDDDGNVIQFREAGHEQEDPITFQARVAAYKFCSKVRKEGCDDTPPTLQRLYDEKADAAYLYDGPSGEFQTWDDLESVARKAAYVAGEELGGVIIWESTGDRKTTTAPDGEIVTVLDEYLDCDVEEDGDRNAAHRNGADILAVAADNGVVRTLDEWDNSLQQVSRTSNAWYETSALAANAPSPYTRWRCQ